MRGLIFSLTFLLFSFLMPPAMAASAVFAGGCFWCMEAVYQDVDGVDSVVSGFTGGSHPKPTYNGAHTGHYEAVLVNYDAAVISYQALLDLFWVNVDPFDAGGQFCDRGDSYRPALFVATPAERAQAQASKTQVVQRFPTPAVVVPILERAEFHAVEEGHQDYYMKNPVRYKYYRYRCGRDERLQSIWGDQAGSGH
jgi:peptide-methionine (S)-S-oxide reductase